ncbi:LLM class F420-dependent oxidoreductase [Acrocarpospora macrocephala]|uniref:LLM class F420-dependent oxidoreductase n=1 Tax=Acrocarpospora macrocephala TaxID=150177 RepID=A0A5M3WUJ1_9ACTN|nr:LLM class flavin-dependent oxidoreductase [Acrocarpospora macrocephala]GES10293.1 LLM class F420-dependent oxidoreductase [Acrocarpospora macrocephala]
MRVGLVDLFDGSAQRDLAYLRAFARTAEEAGFSSLWLPEHLVFFEEYDSAYPYPAAPNPANPEVAEVHTYGAGSAPRVEAAQEQGLLDVLQTAAELCRHTTRLRVGSSVLLLPLRDPRLLVRELATLDLLTGGRFDLGVGVGWSAEEYAAAGVPFAERGARFERNLAAISELWAGEGMPGTGRPLPRVLVGGQSRPAIRRAARYATGWYPWNLTTGDFARHLAEIEAGLREHGRSRADFHVIAGLRFHGAVADLRPAVERYLELGADSVNLSLRMTPATYPDTMREVSRALGLAA